VFHPLELPELQGGNGDLRLMTVRSEGQFNTVVYEDHDVYRGQDRRDVIMMNESDVARMGLRTDQLVSVTSATGELHRIRVRTTDIRPGNAVMYYPEANVIVGRRVDPASKTPAFKATVVTVSPD
jgi:anaerobic selenocysteine-containing dehydrogenase